MDKLAKRLEALVLAHRYLYYVKAEPLYTDYQYDQLERAARKILPESSKVHAVGSSNPEDYSPNIRILAAGMQTYGWILDDATQQFIKETNESLL